MTIRKPILCLDFDGVIHSYTSGWKGADVIPDAPVPGALDFILRAMEHFTVAIYSSRSSQPAGLEAMRIYVYARMAKHLMEHGHYEAKSAGVAANDICNRIQWPTVKPPALVTLDDRAVTFTGNFPGLDELRAFEPWNKRRERELAGADQDERMTGAQIRDYSQQIRGFVAEIDAIPNSTAGLTPGEIALIELLKRIAEALR